MIIVGLGSNVEGPWGTPTATIERALEQLDGSETKLVSASRLIRTKAFGKTDQPDFINAVAIILTALSPARLMRHLHSIELAAERRRTVRWGPRTLDIDLLDYEGRIQQGTGVARGHQRPLILPHPGIAEREFVLLPLSEIAPNWRHPVLAKTAMELLNELQRRQRQTDAN